MRGLRVFGHISLDYDILAVSTLFGKLMILQRARLRAKVISVETDAFRLLVFMYVIFKKVSGYGLYLYAQYQWSPSYIHRNAIELTLTPIHSAAKNQLKCFTTQAVSLIFLSLCLLLTGLIYLCVIQNTKVCSGIVNKNILSAFAMNLIMAKLNQSKRHVQFSFIYRGLQY